MVDGSELRWAPVDVFSTIKIPSKNKSAHESQFKCHKISVPHISKKNTPKHKLRNFQLSKLSKKSKVGSKSQEALTLKFPTSQQGGGQKVQDATLGKNRINHQAP